MGYYLMVKEAVGLGIKYLCKCTDGRNPHEYRGSGILWRRIINKHGCDIKTTVIGHYETNEELRKHGEYYSQLWNIVADKSWANLIPEIGDGGSTTKGKFKCHHPETLQELVVASEQQIPNGWVKGGKPSATKGKTRYHDPITKEIKMLTKTDAIPDGWIQGGPKGLFSYGPRKDQTKVYHNGERKIYVKDGDAIPEGFTIGLHYGGTTKNRVVYYDPSTNDKIYINAGDPVPAGYIKGQPPTTGKQIKTPHGLFLSVQKAMVALNITRYAIQLNIKNNPDEWRYING